MFKCEGWLHWVPDDTFFVSHMIEMNKKKIGNFSIADRASTLIFAGTGSAANSEVNRITLLEYTFENTLEICLFVNTFKMTNC